MRSKWAFRGAGSENRAIIYCLLALKIWHSTFDYVWSSADLPADGSFRPLRRRESMLAA